MAKTLNPEPLGVRADKIDISAYTERCLPKTDTAGRIPTLNKTGFVKVNLDPFSTEFIHTATYSHYPALEIGAAYGAACIKLVRTEQTVIANDIDIDHLILLRQQVPPQDHHKLYLNNKRFPSETNFADNSLGSILCCRVAHFLTGDELKLALKKMYQWLAPGGKLFLVSMSPYHHTLSEFFPIYKERLIDGVEWPGVLHNAKDYWPNDADDIPDMIHLLEEKTLITHLQKIGFKIEKSELFDYGQVAANKNRSGNEYYGFIASK